MEGVQTRQSPPFEYLTDWNSHLKISPSTDCWSVDISSITEESRKASAAAAVAVEVEEEMELRRETLLMSEEMIMKKI